MPTEFICACISDLLQKISNEDKKVILMGDFNIDLLKYDTNAGSTATLGSVYTSHNPHTGYNTLKNTN